MKELHESKGKLEKVAWEEMANAMAHNYEGADRLSKMLQEFKKAETEPIVSKLLSALRNSNSQE